MNTKINSKVIFLISIPLLIWILYNLGLFDVIRVSKYENKIYKVTSSDGRIFGSIKTTVGSCSETEQCVSADYDLTLNDSMPINKIVSSNINDTRFDPNYYYVANIYNNKLDPKKPSFDAILKPINKETPSNSFKIKFTEILRRSHHQPNDFLKLNHLDIYDVSDPTYIDQKYGIIDQFLPLKNNSKIRSYDFIVSPQ